LVTPFCTDVLIFFLFLRGTVATATLRKQGDCQLVTLPVGDIKSLPVGDIDLCRFMSPTGN